MDNTTPKERPILFSSEMVQAILQGRKTQTRRVVKPRSYICDIVDGWPYEMTEDDLQPIKCPYGRVGDILWVRETWCWNGYYYIYRADERNMPFRWKPSIHMPKKACRLFLRIANIRVERLHDISSEDIKAEGIVWTIDYRTSLLDQWELLWTSINGYDSWNDNPYVWVIEFERIQNNDKP